MSIMQEFMEDGPEISLVQNRLTVAGLVLAALFFSANFSIGLYGQLRDVRVAEYRIEFAQIEAPLAIGAGLSLFAIGGLLFCQQLSRSTERWFSSRRWWFAASTLWLYLAAAQAMSAGLTEVVFGLSLVSQAVAVLLGVLALPPWMLLLFGGPIHLLRRTSNYMTKPERSALLLAYAIPLVAFVGLTSEVYRLREGADPTAVNVVRNLLNQLIQPLTWSRPW